MLCHVWAGVEAAASMYPPLPRPFHEEGGDMDRSEKGINDKSVNITHLKEAIACCQPTKNEEQQPCP